MSEKLKNIWAGIKKAMENDVYYKILSFLFAVFMWYFVSISIYPTIERNIFGVTVNVKLDGSYAESIDLQPVDIGAESVKVTISGKRAQIANLTADELVAYINIDNVTSARKYSLPIQIESTTGREFDVLSIEPDTVSVRFDKIVTKTFEVEPDISSISIATGYLKDDVTVTPSTISITGPQNRIDSITNVYAKANTAKELSETTEIVTNNIVLFNSSSNAVISNENEDLTFDKTDFSLIVPVYVMRTIPLEVEIQNAPSGFDIAAFKEKLVLSQNEIVIGAPSDNINDINSFVVGIIDMRYVDIGSTFTYDIILGSGYKNLSAIETVTVTCPSEGLAKKRIPLSRSSFMIINAPSQFNIEPINSGYSIDFIGPAEDIEELTEMDLTAILDLMPYTIEEGTFACPVQISVPSNHNIWPMGTFNISLTAKTKTEPEETTD